MRTLKSFMKMVLELMLGLYYGIFRRGEHYDKETEHLRGVRYGVFIASLLIVLVIIAMIVYPSSL
ncbi:hypothetical protein RQP50_22900 [Paenibacillus sp. chi10]|uniref:Uncharacterized protein n=1 Tax=Paenibacillus suaedae TaxID=3077233 RepID=A0AAJ2N407_9BACL|nr:hypothetical protein [Paenibacillus sp. chi10]MDT8979093.1 hypothetical protein [Paenibacillus sp. chi10]